MASGFGVEAGEAVETYHRLANLPERRLLPQFIWLGFSVTWARLVYSLVQLLHCSCHYPIEQVLRLCKSAGILVLLPVLLVITTSAPRFLRFRAVFGLRFWMCFVLLGLLYNQHPLAISHKPSHTGNRSRNRSESRCK